MKRECCTEIARELCFAMSCRISRGREAVEIERGIANPQCTARRNSYAVMRCSSSDRTKQAMLLESGLTHGHSPESDTFCAALPPVSASQHLVTCPQSRLSFLRPMMQRIHRASSKEAVSCRGLLVHTCVYIRA